MEFAQSKGNARRDGSTGVTFGDVGGLGATIQDMMKVVEVRRRACAPTPAAGQALRRQLRLLPAPKPGGVRWLALGMRAGCKCEGFCTQRATALDFCSALSCACATSCAGTNYPQLLAPQNAPPPARTLRSF
jgi:hypothetical protein